MNRYYGFDLGDAESAVSVLLKEGKEPEVLPVSGAKSFITAYAMRKSGTLVIGEQACYEADVTVRKDRFKSHFLKEPETEKDISAFAAGVLSALYLQGDLVQGEDTCFYVGCPAGWNGTERETYRMIFEKCGYPPVKIISESRAALVSSCQSKHLQIGYDILNKPVLVVDIGSSTTDFAYIDGGREVALKTGGEVYLGGGIMDEILLEEAIEQSDNPKKVRKALEESEPWHSYCDFAARRLKEKYFSDEDYWKDHTCTASVSIHAGLIPIRLTMRLNAKTAAHLYEKKVPQLENRSFREVFLASLEQVKKETEEKPPQLLFLTGGVSKMKAVKEWCRQVFADAVVITGTEPEFSVSKGLAYCGRIDDEVRAFRKDVEDLVASSAVERTVEANINDLYSSCVDALVDPILKEAAMPAVEQWRNGQIERVSDIDGVMQADITAWLHSEEARRIMAKPVSQWLKKISYDLEEYTMPICVKHHVPYSALSLNAYLSAADVQVSVPYEDVFALKEITWLIDAVISIVIGLLCGGGGVALVSSGPGGIVAGSVVSMLLLILGKDKMEKALLHARIPRSVRKMIPRKYLENRMEGISDSVKEKMLAMLEEENEDITDRIVKDLSEQIEKCLIDMAEVVEIPLG